MKRTIFDLCCLLVTITLLSWCLRMAAGAEPRVEVTTTKAGLTIVDASKATGQLTWSIRGDHEILFGGTVAVCRGANYTGALVSVQADGTVAILLLPIGHDTPPPPVGTLAEIARALAKNIPAGQRAAVAKIHSDLAKSIDDGSITSEKALFAERTKQVKEVLRSGRHADWGTWLRKTNDLMDEFAEFQEFGKDGVASGFSQPFKDIARGLE